MGGAGEPRGPGPLLFLLYVLTGASSLVLQVAWSRQLALVFGGTLLTTSAVVAVFLAGLAAGAALFGRLADRIQRPLLLFAALEAGVGLYALASPALLAAIRDSLPAAGPDALSILGRTTLLLLPPTILMGGTFPAILTAVSARAAGRRPEAVLYGANTLGAVLGVLGAAFVALPLLGIRRTVAVAAGTDIMVALGVLLLARSSAAVPRSPPRAHAPAPATPEARLALVVLGLSGAASLIGEIAWTRALSLFLGSSVYAFALVLAAFLLGIAVGSLAYSSRRARRPPLEDLLHYQIRAALGAAIFAVLVVASPRLLIAALHATGGHPAAMAAIAFLVAFAATGYATTAFGAAFPAGLAAVLAGSPPGTSSGRAYAVNTVGAVAGAVAAAALLIPNLGVPLTLATGVALSLVAAAVAARGRPAIVITAVAGTTLAAVALPAWWRWERNQRILTSGIYAYAYAYHDRGPDVDPAAGAATPEHPRPARRSRPPAPSATPPRLTPGIIFMADGAHANIAVLRDARGDLSLLIDGKADASTALDGDMRTQILLGHLPALFHRGPVERALVIGLGSGVTASAVGDVPAAAIDVLELEPLVARVAREHFAAANRGILDDPRVRLVIGDGRAWVGRQENRYDILTSEPSNLWMSGVTHLFTAEFFAEAARALRPDGILCQWMHLYQVSPADVRTVLRGVDRSFPHTHLFLDGPDLLVIASKSALPLPADIAIAEPIARRLAEVGIAGPADLEILRVGDGATLRRFAGSGRLHTDDHPVLEFTAPLSLARDRSQEIARALREATP